MRPHEENEDKMPKEVGSNLTGTAVHAKPGHQRDIPVEKYLPEQDNEQQAPKHIENTDALLGDVNPVERSGTSQEEDNAGKENKTDEKPKEIGDQL